MNNTLNLDYSHVFSRRLQFSLVESGQQLSQNYPLENPALQPGSSVANIDLATSPSIQLLNNTVHQSSTQGSVTYRQTARLSYDATGSYFIVGQTEAGLTGMRGKQFSGDLNYRLDKPNDSRRVLLFYRLRLLARCLACDFQRGRPDLLLRDKQTHAAADAVRAFANQEPGL